MTETAVLNFTSPELPKPISIKLAQESWSLPFTGSITIQADTPASSTTVENVTATVVIDGASIYSGTIESFPFDISAELDKSLGFVGPIVMAVINKFAGTLSLVISSE